MSKKSSTFASAKDKYFRIIMKRSLFILSLLMVTCSLSAQSVLSFGARGGLEFMMPKSDWATMKTKVGYAGIVDIGYTYYWFTRIGDWGIHTGISASFAQNECQIDIMDQVTREYHDGTEIYYSIAGKLNAKLQRAYGEVPLMAAYHKNGIVARLGLKGQFTFWSRTLQEVYGHDIGAFVEGIVVDVLDKPLPDFVGEEHQQKAELKGGAPAFSLLAALQVGYEIKIRQTDRLGVFAYLDYNFWNTGTGTTHQTDNSAFSTAITRINPIQVGVTVYYALELRTYHRHTKSSSIWEGEMIGYGLPVMGYRKASFGAFTMYIC